LDYSAHIERTYGLQ